MNILGIETSCDETAAAVVKDGSDMLSNVVVSQIDIHKAFGGVVPEVAARSHIETVLPVIDEALEQAFPDAVDKWANIDAIAVTKGPGLSGALLIGTITARTLALVKDKPLFGVNHVLAHVYANFISPVGEIKSGVRNQELGVRSKSTKKATLDVSESPTSHAPSPNYHSDTSKEWIAPKFPVLALIVSGGHTQLVLFRNHFDYELLGQTQDDAVGEAFDKVAKVLGLEYPGGPSIQQSVQEGGNPNKYEFPKARSNPAKDESRQTQATSGLGRYDFSFSGLKTAVLRQVQVICGKDHTFPSFELAELLTDEQVKDVAASFQRIAVETLVDKTMKAFNEFSPKTVVIAGGVAANLELRRQLKDRLPIDIDYAPINLCTDNAAMIASLGYFHAKKQEADDPRTLEINTSLKM